MAKSTSIGAEAAEIKVKKTRAPRANKIEASIIVEDNSRMDSFVFMDPAISLLDIGLKTEKNIVLYGPGGHGKSDLALEFFHEKGIQPYVITMGTGITTDRLFGGLDLKKLDQDGKIEYLVENSFMNHEFAIFEELMDAPDFILEQLKDILSSGYFRNGTQVYKIKTRFIVANTNKTREEFSKNDSLKALMERFPMELNVVWPNYNSIAYNTLLEKVFGVGKVDPTIPFILEEYAKNNVTISPRIAIDCYSVYETCGPDSLKFFADFAKKPEIITEALKKFAATIKFKQIGVEIEDLVKELSENTDNSEKGRAKFIADFGKLNAKSSEISKFSVTDDIAVLHAKLISFAKTSLVSHQKTRDAYKEIKNSLKVKETKKEEKELVGGNSDDLDMLDAISGTNTEKIDGAGEAKPVKRRKSAYQY